MKALIIQMPFEVDLHNVIQVARAEDMKFYKVPGMPPLDIEKNIS